MSDFTSPLITPVASPLSADADAYRSKPQPVLLSTDKAFDGDSSAALEKYGPVQRQGTSSSSASTWSHRTRSDSGSTYGSDIEDATDDMLPKASTASCSTVASVGVTPPIAMATSVDLDPSLRCTTQLRSSDEHHEGAERNFNPTIAPCAATQNNDQNSIQPHVEGNPLSRIGSVMHATSKGSVAPPAGSWAAQQELRRSQLVLQGHRAEGGAELRRKMRSLLNKLTPERFESLYEQLASLDMQCPHHVAVLVREIFDKATTQHPFISMYADLCARLQTDSRILKVAAASHPGTQADSFRHILLSQCQASFEEMLTASQEWGTECQDSEEAAELRARCKQRAIGNVKFVGKLLVLGMLSPKLLSVLCDQLLDSRDACPHALESLAALLTATGPTFDHEANPVRPALNEVFGQLQILVICRDVQPRLRFLLRDVLELRSAGWLDSKEVTKQSNGPMKLQDVRSGTKVAREAVAPARPVRFGGPANFTPSRCPSGNAQGKTLSSVGTSVANSSNAPSNKSSSDESSIASPTCPQHKAVKIMEQAVAKSAPMPSAPAKVTAAPAPYCRSAFHKELWIALRELSQNKDVEQAAAKVESQRVPIDQQAGEFADLLTRVVEEPDVGVRGVFFALVGRLASGSSVLGAFSRQACADGIETFFLEMFDDLCDEMDGLFDLVSAELLPILRTVYSATELSPIVPPSLRS